MKVFISWSGNKSHRVATVFREWLPSVIQSLEPYVSSEDIDKGARWSTDIAKELENSTFGILCVTKENLHAPWLSFEAGALSKTMDKSFVTPFLFDIKRSEVNGPILQFQSTVFEKADIKKLLQTLNKACGEGSIPDTRLDRAFEVWYPTLEQSLNELHDAEDTSEELVKETEDHSSAIMEEILELSRDNQKLLRNPDTRVLESIDDIKKRLDGLANRSDKAAEERHIRRKDSMIFMDELLHGMLPDCQTQYAFLFVLNMLQDDFPWLYNMGKGLVDILESNVPPTKKYRAINDCRRLIEFTYDHSRIYSTMASRYSVRDRQIMLRETVMNLLSNMEEEVHHREMDYQPV